MAIERNGFSKGLVIGLLAGGAIGAITALLYAPKSGKELRSDLKKKANDLAEDASELVNTARSKAAETISQTKHRADALASEIKEQADHILSDAEGAMHDVRTAVETESGRVQAAFRAGVETYRSEKDRGHAS